MQITVHNPEVVAELKKLNATLTTIATAEQCQCEQLKRIADWLTAPEPPVPSDTKIVIEPEAPPTP